ncbi:RHTO0S11e05842g1_1 [Rhodotorula toruloides]|uniref:RHTO0S11e05842g1_1 n=1 Tax=Rhodotorula toruloides TaxID=5286 RepID=A0A061BDB5_RHOTO|nr:RHTO0S11e05842g1_1 [Rhodotorula toruloides]
MLLSMQRPTSSSSAKAVCVRHTGLEGATVSHSWPELCQQRLVVACAQIEPLLASKRCHPAAVPRRPRVPLAPLNAHTRRLVACTPHGHAVHEDTRALLACGCRIDTRLARIALSCALEFYQGPAGDLPRRQSDHQAYSSLARIQTRRSIPISVRVRSCFLRSGRLADPRSTRRSPGQLWLAGHV